MTTLPQTTQQVRLPRPTSGGIQLAPQGGPGGGALAAGVAGAIQHQGNEVWRVIRAHIWLILAFTVVLAPSLGYVAYRLLGTYYPRYTASGLVQVNPPTKASEMGKGDIVVPDPGTTALEIRTQAQGLKSDSLLTKVLSQDAQSDIRKTQWFRQFGGIMSKAKADFEENLNVTPLQDTKLVKVEFTYSVPEDCKTIVQSLVSTYLAERQKNTADLLADRVTILTGVKIKTEMRLRDLQGEMREKMVRLNLDGGGIGRIGVKEMELSKLVGEQIEAQITFGKADAMLNAMKGAVAQGQDPPGLDKFVQNAYPYNLSEQAQIRQMDIELDIAAESGLESPKYKAIKKRVDAMKQNYQSQMDAAKATAKVQILEEYAQIVQSESTKLEALNNKVNNLKTDLGELSAAMVTYYTLQDEQRGLLQQIKDVKQQIENVMALQTSNLAVTAQWYAQPEKPLNRSFPRLPMVMAVAVALGLFLSLGIAFLHDAMDQSIRSPRDIARIGQINLLGIVPDESDDPQSAGARLPVVIFDAPHSAMAESFRHVRTKLQHTASLDTTRSIMVTSPSPGDGKTTIACNLAAGLALNGRRILLVDANFRRPEVHKIFGLPNEQGFSDVLNAVAAFDEVLQETQVPNLAVMSAGPKPMNPTELFESQLLIDFIERALEEFDHVIFDSGPLMVVAEAQAMAPRVDGVISVVRAKTNNRGLLQRMRDEMRRTKAEHLGVVLNAVRAQGGGYYRRNIQTYYDYANNG